MCRAVLGLGSSLSSLGEGGIRALPLVAIVRSFVASHSSRRFFLRLHLDVVGPLVSARTAVTHLLSCLDYPGWSPQRMLCTGPPLRLPSTERHRRLLLHLSRCWPRCRLCTRLALAMFTRSDSPALPALPVASLRCTRSSVLRLSASLGS